MRKADIRDPILLLRSPALSEVQRCVQLADGSLNAESHVLKALSKEAVKLGKLHDIILMVDLETGREGLPPEILPDVCRMVQTLNGLSLKGIGIYFAFQSDPKVIILKQQRLVCLARDVEQKTGIPLPIVSGGSTNALSSTTLKGITIPGVTQLRIGTSILLGISSSKGPKCIEGFHQDTFVLSAEIIEIKHRNGLIGILSLGKVDTDPEFIFPLTPGITIINASCDHMLVSLGHLSSSLKIGDRVNLQLGYYALNRLVASPYTRIEYRLSEPITSAVGSGSGQTMASY
jgi:predicted amino acid racemase